MEWEENFNMLSKEFEFNDFKEALSFVMAVGRIAEMQQHHPDITLHDYRFVQIATTTHDEGAVTEKDKMLTESIDELLLNQ